MNGGLAELISLRTLGITGVPEKAPKIIPFRWTPPPFAWVKVNKDGSTLGAPSPAGAVTVKLLLISRAPCRPKVVVSLKMLPYNLGCKDVLVLVPQSIGSLRS